MTTVGTNSFYDRSITSLATLRAQTETLQTQISTNQRLQQASDDPAAARQLRALSSEDTLATTYSNNAGLVGADLSLTSNALTQLTTLTNQAQELATQSASGTLNADQRKLNGDQLAEIYNSMVAILNGKTSTGDSLFAGESNGPAYVIAADGSASYAGSGQPNQVDVGSGISVAGSLTGQDVISFNVNGTNTDLLSVVHNLAVSLQSGSSASASDANSALTSLSQGLTTLSTNQAVIAGRQNRVDLASTLATSLSDMRSSEKTRIGGTDMTTAISQLQETMTVLQASQASFTKLSSLSLFDYLK